MAVTEMGGYGESPFDRRGFHGAKISAIGM